MTNATVQQAVDLLETRRTELLTELAEIDAAVAALSPKRTAPREPSSVRRSQPTTKGRTSVRTAVIETLESADRFFSIQELFDQLGPAIQGDRSDERMRGAIRGALHHLRNDGLVISDDGRQRAAKWLTNAASPAVGAGLAVSIPTSKEGGGANADDPGVLDQSALRKEDDRDHHLGAVLTSG